MSRRPRFLSLMACAAACSAIAAVHAAPVSGTGCGARPAGELPDPATCIAATDVRLSAQSTPAQRIEALAESAKRHAGQGRHPEAEQALDCAAAILGGRSDEISRYRIVRARASVAYVRDRIPEAKSYLECALSLAAAREDRAAIAGDTNALGSTLRRLGDYHGALQALTRSLDMQRAQGKVGGAVLNNIADVYREQGNHDEALRHYREARRTFLDDGKPDRAAHVLESMAVVEMARGQPREAARWLEEALRIYRERGPHDYELRTTGRLIQASLAQGDVAAATRWKSAGLAVAASQTQPLPTVFQWQAARLERVSGDPSAAVARLRAALAEIGEYDPERVDLLQELAQSQEALGDRAAALESLRHAHAQADALAKAKYKRELGWLQTMFETAERDRKIARLESDNHLRAAALRQRTLLLWLTAAVAVAAMLGGWLVLQRRRQRERLAEAARLARKEEELARYRREADALAQDRRLLQTLLDSRDDALCLLDAEGLVLAANRAACQALGRGDRSPVGSMLADALRPDDGAALREALERVEDAQTQQLPIATPDGPMLHAQLAPWPEGDGLVVLALSPRLPTADDEVIHESPPPAAIDADAGSDLRESFRRSLVELMLFALETWERGTGSGRLELAEKSRIWRVAVDDGRVRARAMERYLGVSRLPQNPRWRDVVRTGYYVLEHCAMDDAARARLQHLIDAILAHTRRSALV